MSRFIQHTLLFVIAALVILLDQVAKYLVRVNLPFLSAYAPIPMLADFFTFTNTHNTGAAFGMFKEAGGIFTVVAILVSGAIVFYYRRIPEGQYLIRIALGLQLGGALGNLIDRLFYGTVTDFIFFHWYDQLNAPIFNVADLSITIGVIILAYLMLLEHLEERRAAIRADAATASPVSPTSATHE